MTARRASQLVSGGVVVSVMAALLASTASAQPSTPCAAWDVEYALSASLKLAETPMGKGDGTYPVGPGRVVLRFEDQGGQPGGRATLVSYSLHQHFTIKAKAVFWTTTVVTDAQSRAADRGGSAAEGTLSRTTLAWNGPVRGYRTDGSVTCDGSLCGKFGTPRSGESELHIGPNAVQFGSFEFARDMKTFRMPYVFVSKTDDPKQTSRLALTGREVRRTCVQSTAH
jgi:hypothetical protein